MSYYGNDVAPVIAEALTRIADRMHYYECDVTDIADYSGSAEVGCYYYDDSPNFDYYIELACGNVEGVSTDDVATDLRAALARLHYLAFEFMTDWSPSDAEDEIAVLEALQDLERYGLEAA